MNCVYWQDVLLFEPLPYTERIYTSLSNLDQALVLHPYTGGGVVAQSVERVTPGEEALGSSPLWPSAPYWLVRCQYNVTG